MDATCDICDKARPCVRQVAFAGHSYMGDTSACHVCLGNDECDECEACQCYPSQPEHTCKDETEAR